MPRSALHLELFTLSSEIVFLTRLTKGGNLDKGDWFKIIEEVYKITDKATMPCMEANCGGSCEIGDISETVILLPYEMEYISEKCSVPLSSFKTMDIKNFGKIGIMDYDSICPFLTETECIIRPYRMFDCRSFPIVATWINGKMGFSFAKGCPLNYTLSLSFKDKIIMAWNLLDPILPKEWKEYYDKEINRELEPFIYEGAHSAK